MQDKSSATWRSKYGPSDPLDVSDTRVLMPMGGSIMNWERPADVPGFGHAGSAGPIALVDLSTMQYVSERILETEVVAHVDTTVETGHALNAVFEAVGCCDEAAD